ncbi:MAG TPA: VOC family protein [Cyclobacteriaceae bacterium]|jgi:PhnB protein
MTTLNAYLNFNGNTEEAFNFYKRVFGGEFKAIQRFRDTPEAGKVAAADADKIMHISLPIGNGNVLMGTDALESMGQHLVAGNNFNLSLDADTEEEARRLFNGLSEGGQVTMPFDNVFWGGLFGMLKDKYGIQWMVSYDDSREGV